VKRSFPGAAPARAQDTRDHSGTIVRLNADGSVPADNPLAGNSAYAPEIYTYGHRNIQGIVRHPATGEIWVTEHGPRGSDELNLIQPGRNYGWPDMSLGREYRTQEQFGELRAATSASPGPLSSSCPRWRRRASRWCRANATTPPGRATCWPAGCGHSASCAW
jgi:glucose/arabinose dehydrogenase